MAELPGGIIIRDEVYGSLRRPVDRLGREQPRILGAHGILSAAMRSGGTPPVEVPGDYWTQDLNGDGYTAAIVACPCGETPCVEVGCLKGCDGCERSYFYPLDRVLVFNSPRAAKAPVEPGEPGAQQAPSAELQSES